MAANAARPQTMIFSVVRPMRSLLITLAISCAMLMILFQVSAEGVLPRVFVVGDSISIGYGEPLREALHGIAEYDRKGDTGISRAADNLDQPSGGNAGNSARVLAYLKAVAEKDGLPADVLLLNCGLHDIKTSSKSGRKQIDIGDYENNLRETIQVVQAMGLRMVWINTTPVEDDWHNAKVRKLAKGGNFQRFEKDVIAYNTAAERIMIEYGVPIIDLHTFSLHLIPKGFSDHVHFTPEASKLQATYIAEALRAILHPSNQP